MTARIERVLVTGASSGIGFEVAKRFLAEGSRVIINARDPARLERAQRALGHPDKVIAVAGAVGDSDTGPRLAQAARHHFGGLDVVVNNAGVLDAKPFLQTTEADLDALYHTNLKGTFLVTLASVPLLVAAGGGSVINIGSVFVEHPIRSVPCAAAMGSKAGVHALTRSLASELAAHQIRVNCVAPAAIRTPLIGELAGTLGSLHPLSRVGEPDEVSDAVVYLARASFVTGTVLDVDGGYAHAR